MLLQMVQYLSQAHWYSGLSHWLQSTGPAGIAASSKRLYLSLQRGGKMRH
jgi:hypothetical protein